MRLFNDKPPPFNWLILTLKTTSIAMINVDAALSLFSHLTGHH
jgi:hypothetical protein